MRVLITGATGFIGRPLCAALISAGHSVTALSRNADRARSVLGPAVACIAWASDAAGTAWREAIGRADAVVHLAGESIAERAWTPAVKAALRASRIDTTRQLVEAMGAEDRRPAAFICASGINYFGDRGEEHLTESSPPGDTFLADLCVAWEAEAARAEALGVRVVRHRSGIVLERGGPLDKMLYPLSIPISPWALGLGGPIGSGRQWMPWIHLDDAVGLYVWTIVDEGVCGPINAVAPGLIRNSEFTRALGRALRRPAILPIPGFALRAMIGGFADELLTSQRAEPAVAEEGGYAYRYPAVDEALHAILGKGRR
jgi:hypothetical protein